MSEFEHLVGGVVAKSVDNGVLVGKRGEETQMVELSEDDIDTIEGLDDDEAAIIGDNVVANNRGGGLVELRQPDGTHIVNVSTADNTDSLRGLLETEYDKQFAALESAADEMFGVYIKDDCYEVVDTRGDGAHDHNALVVLADETPWRVGPRGGWQFDDFELMYMDTQSNYDSYDIEMDDAGAALLFNLDQ